MPPPPRQAGHGAAPSNMDKRMPNIPPHTILTCAVANSSDTNSEDGSDDGRKFVISPTLSSLTDPILEFVADYPTYLLSSCRRYYGFYLR